MQFAHSLRREQGLKLMSMEDRRAVAIERWKAMTALERLAWRKKARRKASDRPWNYPLVDLNAREVPMVSVSKQGKWENPDEILDEEGLVQDIKPLQRRLRDARIIARKHEEEEKERSKLAEKAEAEKRIFKNVEDLLSSDDSESGDEDDEKEEEQQESGDSNSDHGENTIKKEDQGNSSDSDDDDSSTSSSSSSSGSRSSPVLTH